MYSRKDQQGRNKTGRTEWENRDLSGEFKEWKTVKKGHKERNRHKNRMKSSWQAWLVYFCDKSNQGRTKLTRSHEEI